MATLRTVAVTGASGMVGRHVVAALCRAEIECWAVDRARWDLRRWASDKELDDIFDGCDAIVHAGAAVPSPGRPVPPEDLIDLNPFQSVPTLVDRELVPDAPVSETVMVGVVGESLVNTTVPLAAPVAVGE